LGERRPRKLGLKEDWASVPFLLIVMAGWVVAAYDFWKLQSLRFQLNARHRRGLQAHPPPPLPRGDG
jgi:hypothetical protein